MSSKNEPIKSEDENKNPIVDPEDVFDPNKWRWSTGRSNERDPPLFFQLSMRNGLISIKLVKFMINKLSVKFYIFDLTKKDKDSLEDKYIEWIDVSTGKNYPLTFNTNGRWMRNQPCIRIYRVTKYVAENFGKLFKYF